MSVIYSHLPPVPNTTAFRPPFVSVIVEYIVLALTLAAFIYGVTSWCVLKKFRHFRNYVYLSAIVASLLRLTTVSMIIPGIIQVITIDDKQILDVCRYICTYFTAVQNYWLLVICYIFYGDIVKVFNGNVSRRFLKSSLFAWGVPLIAFTTYYIVIHFNAKWLTGRNLMEVIADSIELFIIVSPLIINCFIYVVVLCSLFRYSKASGSTATNIWRRFYIATLLFVLSDIIVLSSLLWDAMSVAFTIRAVMSKIQQISIDLFLPLVRSNRELWHEFYINRFVKNIS